MTVVFAISDPHLSLAADKPMAIFGPDWDDHANRLAVNWRSAVSENDIVIVAGDISWAMKLDDAAADFNFLAELPGRKVFVRGNHDYWWSSIGKVRSAAPAGMFFLQNDSLEIDGFGIGGSRMWDFPDIRWTADKEFRQTDEAAKVVGKNSDHGRGEASEKIRRREIDRLRLSLSKIPESAPTRIAVMHYPPVGEDGQATLITDICDEFRIDYCIFGHLHSLGKTLRPGADCTIGSTRYLLTSCDWLGFKPIKIC